MTYFAERDGDRIVLQAALVSKDRAKAVPGARYDSKARRWTYPLTWAHCVMLRGEFGTELDVGPELAEWAEHELHERIVPALKAREGR